MQPFLPVQLYIEISWRVKIVASFLHLRGLSRFCLCSDLGNGTIKMVPLSWLILYILDVESYIVHVHWGHIHVHVQLYVPSFTTSSTCSTSHSFSSWLIHHTLPQWLVHWYKTRISDFQSLRTLYAPCLFVQDTCEQVRDRFVQKLNKGLKSLRLPLGYLSIFALAGIEPRKEIRLQVLKQNLANFWNFSLLPGCSTLAHLSEYRLWTYLLLCTYLHVAVPGRNRSFIPLCISIALLHSKRCSIERPLRAGLIRAV